MTSLNHVRRGSGEPLLLIHPLGADSSCGSRCSTGSPPQRDVIAVDMPGFGASPALSNGSEPTPQALARPLGRFLDALGLERVHVAGNSLGGWVALELAKAGRALSVTGLCSAGFWTRPLGPRGGPDVRRIGRALLPLIPALVRSARGRRRAAAARLGRPSRARAARRGGAARARLRDLAGLRGAPTPRCARTCSPAWSRSTCRSRSPGESSTGWSAGRERSPSTGARVRAARLRPHPHLGRSRAGVACAAGGELVSCRRAAAARLRRRRRQPANNATSRAITSRQASTGSTKASTTRNAEPASSSSDRIGLPMPPVVAVESGRTAARPACTASAVPAPEHHRHQRGHVRVHAGLAGEQDGARDRRHHRADPRAARGRPPASCRRRSRPP